MKKHEISTPLCRHNLNDRWLGSVQLLSPEANCKMRLDAAGIARKLLFKAQQGRDLLRKRVLRNKNKVRERVKK
jgi:hypothetical protein